MGSKKMDGLKNLYELCVAKSEKPVAYFLNGGGLEEKPEGIGRMTETSEGMNNKHEP